MSISADRTNVTTLKCTCGKVRIEVEKAPIISAECCCTSCREAGTRLQALPGAPTIMNKIGATRFVLYRKDRASIIEGESELKAFRLSSEAATRRVVAACCNTPVYLEFDGGHWLSLYGGLWPDGALPRLELRDDDLGPSGRCRAAR